MASVRGGQVAATKVSGKYPVGSRAFPDTGNFAVTSNKSNVRIIGVVITQAKRSYIIRTKDRKVEWCIYIV